MATDLSVRPSPIAGQWYPADSKRLAAEVDHYIQSARLPPIPGKIIAVMAPHAGHQYSGGVAGHAFQALQGLMPEIIAVVSPMHYPYADPLLTTAHKAYKTPLGEIVVDLNALAVVDRALSERLGITLTRVANDPEHSLEIELPFLQRAVTASFTILPIMVRDQSERVTHAVGAALAEALVGREALLVASTDLSHFYPQSIANELDSELLRHVAAFDPVGVLNAEKTGRGFACGRGALASVMWAAKALGANHALVLNYATSGDVTGDFSRVVGYGSAVFSQAPETSSN